MDGHYRTYHLPVKSSIISMPQSCTATLPPSLVLLLFSSWMNDSLLHLLFISWMNGLIKESKNPWHNMFWIILLQYFITYTSFCGKIHRLEFNMVFGMLTLNYWKVSTLYFWSISGLIYDLRAQKLKLVALMPEQCISVYYSPNVAVLRCTLGHDKYPFHFKAVFSQYTSDNIAYSFSRGRWWLSFQQQTPTVT